MPSASSQPLRTGRSRQVWVEAALVVAFWSLLLLLNIGRRIIDPRGGAGVTLPVLLPTALEYLLWIVLTPGIFWLARRYGLEQADTARSDVARSIGVHVLAALVVALLVDAFGHLMFDRFLPSGGRPGYHPLQNLVRLRFLDELIIYLAVLGAGFARVYFLRYRERRERAVQLEADKARLQAQLIEAQLQALRMQLNPHFLFNTLHAVASLVERDPAGVRRMIARLSELLRYTLEHSSAQEIPLRQELDLLHRYLDIQQVRFQEQLDVEADVALDVRDALVPNLILQPLVENAIKHGISQLEGAGQIRVRAWRDGADLRLEVRDNGPGLSGDGALNLEQGVGLRNTRARLEGLYGMAQHLHFREADPTGFVVDVRLPFHTAADLVAEGVSPLS